MSTNMGIVDRVARLVAALPLIAFAIPIGFAPGSWNWLGWIGVVPLITAFFGVCPLYSLIGMATCPTTRTE